MRRTRASWSELDGVIVSGQTALTSGIAVDLDDGSGPIRVMVGTATGIDVTGWTRDARLHLRGVVGQRDSSGSGTAGYRVQPRDAADILAVTPPATSEPDAIAQPLGDTRALSRSRRAQHRGGARNGRQLPA